MIKLTNCCNRMLKYNNTNYITSSTAQYSTLRHCMLQQRQLVLYWPWKWLYVESKHYAMLDNSESHHKRTSLFRVIGLFQVSVTSMFISLYSNIVMALHEIMVIVRRQSTACAGCRVVGLLILPEGESANTSNPEEFCLRGYNAL